MKCATSHFAFNPLPLHYDLLLFWSNPLLLRVACDIPFIWSQKMFENTIKITNYTTFRKLPIPHLLICKPLKGQLSKEKCFWEIELKLQKWDSSTTDNSSHTKKEKGNTNTKQVMHATKIFRRLHYNIELK